MGFDQPVHWIVVAIAAALLFGGYKKLPEMARSAGRSMRIFKTELKGMADDDDARTAAKADADAQEAEAAAVAARAAATQAAAKAGTPLALPLPVAASAAVATESNTGASGFVKVPADAAVPPTV